MQHNKIRQNCDPAREENPFKRRGPGAANAAPLAFTAACEHGSPSSPAKDSAIKSRKLDNQILRKRSRADGAGPSPAAQACTDMQPGVFPRCRISSLRKSKNAEGRRGRGESFAGSGGQSRPKCPRHHGAGSDDEAPQGAVSPSGSLDVGGGTLASNSSNPEQVQRAKTAYKRTDVETDLVFNSENANSDVPGTEAMLVPCQPAGGNPDIQQPLSAGPPAGTAVAKPVSGSTSSCKMPVPPEPGLVPGVAMQYTIRTDDGAVRYKQTRLKTYRQHFDMTRASGRAKPDLIANSVLRKLEPQQAYIGHPLGVKPGDRFEGRGELEALGIHGKTLLGIDGSGSHPAFAICMSGGYVDDEDAGAEIWYTGMGGQKGKRQVLAQELTRGNLALKTSMDLQTPVRVCRAAGMEERSGHMYRMYAYEGLYLVKEMAYVKSHDGPEVYKFKLVAVDGHAVASATVKYNHFSGNHAVISRRVLKPAQVKQPNGRTESRKHRRDGSGKVSTAKSARPSAKTSRELKWRWDNTAAEMRELEKRRWAGHGWSGAKAQAGLLNEDISGGSERVRIALVNDSGQVAPLPEFTYQKDYTFSPAAVVYMSELFARRLVQWSGSKATVPAAGKTLPDFASEHSVLYNQESGMLERIQFTPCMEDRPSGVPQLLDVASRGVFLPLQVFYTADKGWGVRCEVDLPIGTFVCCYVGRVCTHSEANELRGRDEYIFDLNHFESVAQHLAESPDEATKEELRLLPRLPPEDFFSWASSIPRMEQDPSTLPPISDLVRDRGIARKDSIWHAADSGGSKSSDLARQGQEQTPLSTAEGMQSAGEAMKSLGASHPSARITAKGARHGWVVNKGGQVSASAAQVLHECRQVHGGQGVWTSYENGRDVGETLSQDCEILAVDAMLEGNVARFINHSCEPNLEKQTIMTWQAGSSVYHYIGFFASAEAGIPAMTELQYDYSYSLEKESSWSCQCGAAACRGLLR